MAEKVLLTDTFEQTSIIFGNFDINVQLIEKAFGVKITNRDTERTAGNAVVVSGEQENVENAFSALAYLKKLSVLDDSVSEQNVDYIINMIKDGKENELDDFGDDCICITSKGKPIKAKTVGQKHYVDAIKKNMVVMGIGPAGTGKTFLAVAMAVTALRNKQVSRIILTRPAVEAGEKLGYLPGDLQNKIDPYLRPLYDAMYELMGGENYLRNLEKGVIEIAPLAYMRGRTLDDSFIILDEAQNTTPEQMKMFLTRLGFNTKAVVTGDITQTDLPFGKKSGLVESIKILSDVEGIAIHHFSSRDVVRHKLVQRIINAYEKYEKENAEKAKKTVIKRNIK
ncbi:MAG: phosphate starvation-inducible protein PhoH [Ruminococcaceae bacterium]|nr:phosphate starvation-inducible protein PhoH [Oscillospiraceae bacterium]